ncbi:MAG: family 10 glycosylhydrolase, partial [Cyanobacteria bacterium P01_A01_bin.40]
NTVFFETLNSSYTIYPSQVAPQQNPLVKGWDPLKAAVKLAHERGMELHAWVWTFAAVNQRHNTILDLPRNHLGPVLSRHPDWAITDHEGSRFHYSSGKVFLDPANPEVREYLLALITEIATNYQIDGIHLDYIRYPFQSPTGKMTYGYGTAAREQFQKLTGFDPIELDPLHPLWSRWTDFRIEQVDSFVEAVSQNLQQLRPELTLSTAVFPMPKQERLSKIQQSWEKWVNKEWIDMLIPMTYAKSTDRLNSLTSPLIREFDHGKALLLPGIRLLNISDVAALDQMQLIRGMSTQGYALFAAENLDSRLTTIFNSTQGEQVTESKQILPHRQPFKATMSRYQGLQHEWNYFLIENSPEIDAVILRKWGQQADRLKSVLENLIDEPSGRNFFSARLALKSLRRQFPDWMAQTKDIDKYQAQVWQSRLDALDRLLSYGERKSLDSY